jgi:hypothetical protein
MTRSSTVPSSLARRDSSVGPDSIERRCGRIRDTIEELVRQELDAVLGAVTSARVGETRQGYRHGRGRGG